MPQIPRRRDVEVAQAPLSTPSAPKPTAMQASGIGEASRGLIQTGAKIEVDRQERVAKKEAEYQDFMAKETQRADEVNVRDIDLGLMDGETKIGIAVKNMKGKKAAEAVDYVESEWEKMRQIALSQTYNENQVAKIEAISEQRRAGLNRAAQIHMDSESRAHDEDQYKTYSRTLREQMALNYDSPETLGRNFTIMKLAIEQQASRNGHDKAWVDDQIAQQRSQGHAAIMERMIVDGDEAAAKAYDEKYNKEIQQDELNMLAKIRKTDKESKAEAKENLMRTLFLGTFSDDKRPPNVPKVGLDEIQTLLAQGVIDVGDYKLLETKITNVNDDPTIPAEERMAAQLEVIDAFEALAGKGKVKGGKPTEELEAEKTWGPDLTREQIQGFRNLLIEKTRYLPESFQNEFLKNTNKAALANESDKMAVWSALAASLHDIGVPPAIRAKTMKDALSIFEKDILFNKAEEKLFNLKEKAVREMNPNRSKYYLEQILTIRGIPVKVVGFDADGEPMIMQFPEASKKGKK